VLIGAKCSLKIRNFISRGNMASLQPILNIVRFKSPSVFDRLMLDEALFRDKLKRTWFVLEDVRKIRDKTTIILGLSGKANEMVHQEHAKTDGVELIRRFTGGGTVAVDDNAFLLTIITNASQVAPKGLLQPYPREIMRWTDDYVYRPAFKSVALSSNDTFKSRENDYVINEHYKVGGNAQGISGDRFCHHTSFLWKVNEKTMSYLKHPKKKPDYRGERGHMEFLLGLEGIITSPKDFSNSVVENLANALSAKEVIHHENDDHLPPILTESRNIKL
jgi:lipoate-protein ligase A